MNQLGAAVILLDRRWLETNKQATVDKLVSSPHHVCTILVSHTADPRFSPTAAGREDVSIRAENVLRAVKLALARRSGLDFQVRRDDETNVRIRVPSTTR